MGRYEWSVGDRDDGDGDMTTVIITDNTTGGDYTNLRYRFTEV